jgi:hypothetical protein
MEQHDNRDERAQTTHQKHQGHPMTRRDEVVISRLRTSYCRETHAAIMNREPRPECPSIDDRSHLMAM